MIGTAGYVTTAKVSMHMRIATLLALHNRNCPCIFVLCLQHSHCVNSLHRHFLYYPLMITSGESMVINEMLLVSK